MEKNGYTRKVWSELSNERRMIMNLKNNVEEAKTDRTMILKTAAEKFYGWDKDDGK